MRRMLLAFALLTACQMSATSDPAGSGAPAIPTDEISVTSLDAAPAPTAAAATLTTDAAPVSGDPEPEAAPTETEAAAEPEPAISTPEEPEAPKTAEQLLCEKSGGQWAVAGKTGANICVKPTRDGGKQCKKKGDCQGQCLARSGTCAPFAPLYGCNEILEKDGRRVTLCID